jgi:hypothetical protein
MFALLRALPWRPLRAFAFGFFCFVVFVSCFGGSFSFGFLFDLYGFLSIMNDR